jgi:hypothetical protein
VQYPSTRTTIFFLGVSGSPQLALEALKLRPRSLAELCKGGAKFSDSDGDVHSTPIGSLQSATRGADGELQLTAGT